MKLKRTMPHVAQGLLVLASLAVFDPAARAGCDGCATAASPTHFSLHKSCNGCHYKPGNCPTLCSPETFGYFPTVWSVWPGPLDPNTSYPGAPIKPAVAPSAEKPVDKPK